MYKRILVPIDGSETGRLGLKEAIGLAADQKATLCLFHVTNDLALMVEAANTIEVEKYRVGLNEFGQNLLDEAAALASNSGVKSEAVLHDIRGGRVSDAIIEEAQRNNCDLIVIGTHGRRGIRRALLGSDAEGVARQSPIPVLLVRDASATK